MGERSGLFFEIVRIVEEMREATGGLFPKYVVLENVPGLLSSESGRDFAVVLGELARVGALDIAWRVCDAQYWGVAQRRRRVFLVADFGGERAAQILFEPAGGGRDTPPRREAGERVTGPIADSSGERGWSSSVDVQMWVEVPSVEATLGSHTSFRGDLDGHGAYIPTVAGALSTRYGKGINTTADDGAAIAMTIGLGSDPLHARELAQPVTGRNGDPGVVGYSFDWQKGNDVTNARPSTMNLAEDQSLTLGTTRTPAVAFTERTGADGRNIEAQEELAYSLNNPGEGGRTQENRVCYSVRLDNGSANPFGGDEVAPTIRKGAGGKDNMAASANVAVLTQMAVRRLTPTECERLQGFPDGWTDGQSDSARYRQLGNAVCVNVSEWIARRMAAI